MSQYDTAIGNLIIITQLKGGMLGKLDFQKTVYISKEIGVDVPFEFKWDKLGPFSFELASFINQLLAKNILTIKSGKYDVDSHNENLHRLKNQNNIEPETLSKLKTLFHSIHQAVHKGKFSIPLFMECIGSLKFIKESRHCEKNEAINMLYHLKPDKVNDFKPMVNDAWDLILKNEL